MQLNRVQLYLCSSQSASEAMNYWPDRVRLKCKTDKSLAIAHGLEELYIEPLGKVKKVRNKKNAGVDK